MGQRRNASAEEVEYIAGLVSSLVQTGVNWIDDKGRSRPLQLDRRPRCRSLQRTGFRLVEPHSERAGRHGG